MPTDQSSPDVGQDTSVDTTTPIDSSPDVSVPDASGDGAPVDGGVDGAGDAVGDAVGDIVVDAPSNAPLWGYVSRTAPYVLDGKGPLYVALLVAGLPIHQAQVAQADLSAAGAQVLYEVWGVPSGGYVLTAFLDDNGNAFPVLPFADPGDLVVSAPPQVTIGGGSLRKDLVLDKVEGGAPSDGGIPDALADVGAVKGKVSATAAPTLDAKGTVHISLHTQLPPAGLVSATIVNNADLSSPFASEGYFLGGIKAGKYYLRAFLDDNNNVNPFAVAPDAGDLVHTNPIQVHVVGGGTNVQDVVLDKVMQ